jgi:hypothetical protein
LNISPLDGNAGTGLLAKENIGNKVNNVRGLNGVMAGDFYTTSQSWYNEYWNNGYYTKEGRKPDPNSDDYSRTDWLTQKIWRQSALLTPSLSVKQQTKDLLTGLPVVREGESFQISWNNFMGVAKTGNINSNAVIGDGTSNWPLQYRVTQVDATNELGMTASNLRSLGTTSPTSFIKSGSRAKRQFNGVGSEIQKGFDFVQEQNAFVETFKINLTPGMQGERFFRIQLSADLGTSLEPRWNPVGVPIYFMVTDG